MIDDNMYTLPDPTHVMHNNPHLTEWNPGGDLGGEDEAVVAAAAAAAAEAVDEEVGSTGGSISEATGALVFKDNPMLPKRLTKERKEKLDAIGFVWSLRSKRIDDHWDEMFRQVSAWKKAKLFAF